MAQVFQPRLVLAFKLGVLGSAANARAVAGVLAEHPRVPVVLDPVLASARGDALSDEMPSEQPARPNTSADTATRFLTM